METIKILSLVLCLNPIDGNDLVLKKEKTFLVHSLSHYSSRLVWNHIVWQMYVYCLGTHFMSTVDEKSKLLVSKNKVKSLGTHFYTVKVLTAKHTRYYVPLHGIASQDKIHLIIKSFNLELKIQSWNTLLSNMLNVIQTTKSKCVVYLMNLPEFSSGKNFPIKSWTIRY